MENEKLKSNCNLLILRMFIISICFGLLFGSIYLFIDGFVEGLIVGIAGGSIFWIIGGSIYGLLDGFIDGLVIGLGIMFIMQLITLFIPTLWIIIFNLILNGVLLLLLIITINQWGVIHKLSEN